MSGISYKSVKKISEIHYSKKKIQKSIFRLFTQGRAIHLIKDGDVRTFTDRDAYKVVTDI